MKLVIKLGGELLTAPQEAQTRSIIEDVCALQNEGYEIIFVHGGGPQTTALQKALGQKPNIVGGRRITDQETLQAIKMAVGGDANLELCRQILARGLVPVGLNGASGAMIRAIRRPPRVVSGCGEEPIDFGLVGDVTGVNADVLNLLTTQQFVPVIACIGADSEGHLYNINADIVNRACISVIDRYISTINNGFTQFPHKRLLLPAAFQLFTQPDCPPIHDNQKQQQNNDC